ncbi:MAG: ribosomal L7Ae/L30e/S12e/Gadd45 family protein [Clostridia bacterium]|nr:ribosomal L7Ae/L30e/S12e/Gadd45 family protein [Clostridia bacterium]
MSEQNDQKVLRSLGLCARAGKLIFGVPMICEAMRHGGANAPRIVFEAADTSENTHKKISDKCSYYQVKQVRLSCDGATLAAALGKTSTLAAVAVSDRELCRLMENALSQ